MAPSIFFTLDVVIVDKIKILLGVRKFRLHKSEMRRPNPLMKIYRSNAKAAV